MDIIFGYNTSDTTYGWSGERKGFTLYYQHFTEEHLTQGDIQYIQSS